MNPGETGIPNREFPATMVRTRS